MRFLEVTRGHGRDLSAWKQVTETASGTTHVDFIDSPFGVTSSTTTRFMAALKLGFKQTLWLLSKLIIASPVFVALQFVLNGGPYAKYVIVGFVLLVCGFFAALNAFVFFSFLHHFYAKRANLIAAARDPESYAVDLLEAGHVEIFGRVRALAPGDVVTQHVSLDPEFRLTMVNDFVLEDPSGRLTYVSVEEAPTLAGPPAPPLDVARHVDLFRLLDRRPTKTGDAMVLREGARVRLVTPRVESVANLERIEIDGEIKSAAREGGAASQGRYREALGSGQLARVSRDSLIIAR